MTQTLSNVCFYSLTYIGCLRNVKIRVPLGIFVQRLKGHGPVRVSLSLTHHAHRHNSTLVIHTTRVIRQKY